MLLNGINIKKERHIDKPAATCNALSSGRFGLLVLLFYFGLAAEAQERQDAMKAQAPLWGNMELCQENPELQEATMLIPAIQPWQRQFPELLFTSGSHTRHDVLASVSQAGPYASIRYLQQTQQQLGAPGREIPKPSRGWFCRMEDDIARKLPWAIDFGTD